MSATWVFGHRTLHSKTLEFGIFALIGVIGLAFNELGLRLLSTVIGLYYLWAKLATTAGVFAWNFFVRKVALFR